MKRIGISIMLMCLLLSVVVLAQSSANYKIVGGDLNSGGSVNMASGSYRASVTIGQSSPVGVANSASYQAQMGVQYVYASQASPAPANSFLLWTK